MPDTAFTGQIKRGEAPDRLSDISRKPRGWTIKMFGTRDPGGGYTLTGVLGDPPDVLRIEAIDGRGDRS